MSFDQSMNGNQHYCEIVQSRQEWKQQVNFDDDLYKLDEQNTLEYIDFEEIDSRNLYPKNNVKKIQYKRIQRQQHRNKRKHQNKGVQ